MIFFQGYKNVQDRSRQMSDSKKSIVIIFICRIIRKVERKYKEKSSKKNKSKSNNQPERISQSFRNCNWQ